MMPRGRQIELVLDYSARENSRSRRSSESPARGGVEVIPAGEGSIDLLHNTLIARSAAIIAINALFMFISELIIEVLLITQVFPKIPFRVDFFALTTISALLGYQTVRGVYEREIDVTSNSLIISASIELSLIVGDVAFLIEVGEEFPAAIPTRGVFIVLTMVNLVLVSWIYHRLHLNTSLLELLSTALSQAVITPSKLLFGHTRRQLHRMSRPQIRDDVIIEVDEPEISSVARSHAGPVVDDSTTPKSTAVEGNTVDHNEASQPSQPEANTVIDPVSKRVKVDKQTKPIRPVPTVIHQGEVEENLNGAGAGQGEEPVAINGDADMI